QFFQFNIHTNSGVQRSFWPATASFSSSKSLDWILPAPSAYAAAMVSLWNAASEDFSLNQRCLGGVDAAFCAEVSRRAPMKSVVDSSSDARIAPSADSVSVSAMKGEVR